MNYSDSEKAVIVAKCKQGVTVQELSTEYGVSERTIYRWTKQYSTVHEEQFSTLKEHKLLLRRVEKLENIIAILKTVNCTVHAPLKEKLTELELLYGQYDVHTLCEALDVSRGTFYNHILICCKSHVGNGPVQRPHYSEAGLPETNCQREEKGHGQTTISCGQAQSNLGQ